jgi:hypothetical protein
MRPIKQHRTAHTRTNSNHGLPAIKLLTRNRQLPNDVNGPHPDRLVLTGTLNGKDPAAKFVALLNLNHIQITIKPKL